MLIAVDFANYTNQIVAGLSVGSIYALFALGLTVTYKASRVPNFAHGAIGVIGAYGFYKTWQGSNLPQIHRTLKLGLPWVGQWEFTPPQMPLLPALIVGILTAVLLSMAIERLIMRHFAEAPMINKIIVTIAMLVTLQAFIVDASPYEDPVNFILKDTWFRPFPGFPLWGGQVNFSQEQALIMGVALALTLGLSLFFKMTNMGIAIRAVADSRDVSRLLGVNANRVATTAWAISGALAGIAAILLTPRTQLNAIGLTALLVKGFTASLFGGFTSIAGTFAGGLVLGTSEAVLPALGDLTRDIGIPGLRHIFYPFRWLQDSARVGGNPSDFITLALILVLLLWRPRFAFRHLSVEEEGAVGLARSTVLVPPEDQVRKTLASRGLLVPLLRDWLTARWLMGGMLMVGLVIFPLVVTSNYWNTVVTFGIVIALIALSIVVVTGWTGQISLAPLAFMGGGAFFAALLSSYGWPLVVFLPMSAVGGAVLALVIGLPALRLKGFFLALATLAFAFATERWLLQLPLWRNRNVISRSPLPDGSDSPVTYVAIGVAVAVFFLLFQLQRTGTVRAFFAIRDSERTAVAMGIDPVKYKLLAFAISGAIAGLAGGLFGLNARIVTPASFLALLSISYLLYAVLGGIAMIAGAVFVGLAFGVLPELTRTEATGINNAPIILGGVFAIITVLQYPTGFTAFLKRLVRPFNRALEFEAWTRVTEAHAPAEDDEAAAAALERAAEEAPEIVPELEPTPGGGSA